MTIVVTHEQNHNILGRAQNHLFVEDTLYYIYKYYQITSADNRFGVGSK